MSIVDEWREVARCGEPRRDAEVASCLAEWTAEGIGVNGFLYVGHNWIRRQVIGMEDRAPTVGELDEMRVLVRRGMEQGAYGLSSGLFYLPGNYAETEEVVELNRIAAEYPGPSTTPTTATSAPRIRLSDTRDRLPRASASAKKPGPRSSSATRC